MSQQDVKTAVATLMVLSFAAPFILRDFFPRCFRRVLSFAHGNPIVFGIVLSLVAHLLVEIGWRF